MRIPTHRKPRAPRSSEPPPPPGPLAILLDFVNTSAPRAHHDALATPREVGDWLERRKILPPATVLTVQDARRTQALREGLRAIFRSHNGHPLDAAAIGDLDRAWRGAPLYLRLELDDGSAWFERLARDLDGALGCLAGIFMTAQMEGHLPRLKICESGDCGQAFYDYSKARVGKWCTARCGDRMRSRAYRRRRRRAESANFSAAVCVLPGGSEHLAERTRR